MVNASCRGPGPPTKAHMCQSFCHSSGFPVTSVLVLTKALEGHQSESLVCHGLPVGTKRRCGGGARVPARPRQRSQIAFFLARIEGGSKPISGIESMIVTCFPAAVSGRTVLVNPSSNRRRSHHCEETSPSPESLTGPPAPRPVAAPFGVKRPARDQHDVPELGAQQEVEDAPV